MDKNQSLEGCTNCGPQHSFGDQTARGAGAQTMTYNEGDGIKDKIVLTGPLSAVMASTMNWLFEKRPLDLVPNAPEQNLEQEAQVNGGLPAASTESIVQDQYIEDMVSQMKAAPDLPVVLADYDVQTVKDHVQQAIQGERTVAPEDAVPVYVCEVDVATDPKTYEELMESGYRGMLLAVGDTGRQGPLHSPYNELVFVGDKENTGEDTLPSAVSAESLCERIYAGSDIQVCVGFEAFAQALKARK